MGPLQPSLTQTPGSNL